MHACRRWVHIKLARKFPIDSLMTQQGTQHELCQAHEKRCNTTPHVTAGDSICCWTLQPRQKLLVCSTWAVWYDTGLLIKLTPKGVVFFFLSAATFFQSTPWPRHAEGDLRSPSLLAHAGWQLQEPSLLAADNKVAFSENNFSENKFSANSFSANSFSETTSVQNCLQPKLIRSACRLQPKQVMLQSCLLWNLIRCTIELQSKPVMSPKLFLIKLYKVPRLSIKASDFCKYVFSRNW